MSKVIVTRENPGCLVQLLWFALVGWWAGELWIAAAWVLMVTIVGAPIGVAMINIVPQVIALTAGTIAENIAFGRARDEIDMTAVERAARLAQLHDFVVTRTEFGYNTEVGDRGVKLSGGQRQRIGIARALYHDPDVLVLDEATSALDTLTEAALMKALEALGGRKTVIMIAHRLSTVRKCDEIFLLEEGRLTDQGSYDELIERNPIFRHMALGAA